MPQETLGYVKMEWTCPKCRSRNLGTEKVCLSCGAPQPKEAQFEQVEHEKASQDEQLKKRAEAGPDVHCSFCGTRNPAEAKVCLQCGADLKEAARRETGKVVGAYQPKPVKQIDCPNCGAKNPETALKCSACGATLASIKEPVIQPTPVQAMLPGAMSNKMMIGLVAALVLLCICGIIGYIWMSSPRESQNASVQNVEWTTNVAIEELGPVNYQTWKDEIPQEAILGSCVDQVRYTQDQEPFSGNYKKVCGTPYTVDTGSGVGKVVQDCRYEVLEPYCEYTVNKWRAVDQASQSGNDLNPFLPNPQLGSDQRLGEQTASYVVVFETSKGQYTYPVSSLEEFQRFQMGSDWVLKINALGQIVSVEPGK
jgi:ribosomal protein L40E